VRSQIRAALLLDIAMSAHWCCERQFGGPAFSSEAELGDLGRRMAVASDWSL
jgi:hypothetical protein